MNSLPADQRGPGRGMRNTFQNSASVLSIGVFFTLITLGLASTLPTPLSPASPPRVCPPPRRSNLPPAPIGSLFAAFLGINPIQTEVPQHVLASPVQPTPST